MNPPDISTPLMEIEVYAPSTTNAAFREVRFTDSESGETAWTGYLNEAERRQLANRLYEVAHQLMEGLIE